MIATAGADPRLVALDLLAQAEHGDDSLVVAVSDDEALLAAIAREVDGGGPTVAGGPKVAVAASDPEAALAFAEALAPEHLELRGRGRRGAGAAGDARRLPVRGRGERDRVRRLRGGFEPHPADCRRRPLRPASPRATSAGA